MVRAGTEDAESGFPQELGASRTERLAFSPFFSNQQHQAKQNHRDEGHRGVEQDFLVHFRPGDIDRLFARRGLDANLFLVFEVPHHLTGSGVAVARITLERAIQNLLKLRRNFRVKFARRLTLVQERSFITASGFGPTNGTRPVSIS